jgi:hypothetical protein
MSIEDKAITGIETDPNNPITNVTIRILDEARFELGNETTIGGAFQIGNRYGEANLLNNTKRINESINFTLVLDGPGAIFQIGKQGFYGSGVGITGNQVDVPNFFALSTLTNVQNVTINLIQGTFAHDQIASSLDENGSLWALGGTKDEPESGYTFTINPDLAVLLGGANLASITEGNRIHPTVQDIAGDIDPGGIRNRIVEVPDTVFDEFYGPPNGRYASETFSLNQMTVGITSSSLMLFDTNKPQIGPNNATQQELFNYLTVAEYTTQGRKRAPITSLENELLVDFVTNGQQLTISRPVVDPVTPCSPLSVPFDADKVLKEGAVGVKVAIINGVPTVIRVYDLDPVV